MEAFEQGNEDAWGRDRASDEVMWKERKPSVPVQDLAKQKKKPKSLVDQQTKVLASLVPDEIIYDVDNYEMKQYYATLLFGDVSGFTDLSEKYSKAGRGGPSRLTQVLNAYIGSMVQEVMAHQGDVLKFSGDAFLAMWKSGIQETMQDVVHEALDCALNIQKSYGTYQTDVGVTLKVKLAVSAGLVTFSLIGDHNMSHYVVIGQPIWDVKQAEYQSSAGEIIVSPSAWHYINPNEYLSQIMKDGLHIKVLGLGPAWRNTHRTMRYQKEDIEDKMEEMYQLESSRSKQDSLHMLKNVRGDDESEYTLRPSVNDAAKLKIKDQLRKFMIGPVIRGIDLGEPMENLTEMRHNVILFINVVTQKIDIPEYVRLVDQAYKTVCRIVNSMEGCVNKVSLFDKDMMFLVIFGLRGFKHDLESQIGLRCAMETRTALSNIKHVKTASIGVTTGMTYCGVVGHTLRREYTVISIIVNKAARLMVAYPNKVSCDRETFLLSKLEARNFILQEAKELKGLSNVGPVYEFKELPVTSRKVHEMNPYPLLGRDEEIRLYKKLLIDTVETQRHRNLGSAGFGSIHFHNVLLIKGDARQGKTRLLDELVYVTPSVIHINHYTLSSQDNKTPFQTIRLMFYPALGINETYSSTDREVKIASILQTKVKLIPYLCSLNGIFSVSYIYTQEFLSLSDKFKFAVRNKMLEHLCKLVFAELWVIAIDDAEFIDDESLTVLPDLLEIDMFFMVMTMGTRKALSATAQVILAFHTIRVMELKPVDKWYHSGLACQMLRVQGIPPDLEKMIQTKSYGNPGWIESYLVSLIQAGGLHIRNINSDDVNELGLVVPPIDMMIRLTKKEQRELNSAKQFKLDVDHSKVNKDDNWEMFQFSYRDSLMNLLKEKFEARRLNREGLVPICLISQGFKLEDTEAQMDVMILKTFDALTSYEQQMLKCSSVLGEYFPRKMLLYIMRRQAPRSTALAVAKLFELRVLGCAAGDFTKGDDYMMFELSKTNPDNHAGIRCTCTGIEIHETCLDLPPYASCGYMRFIIPLFRTTTYNLLIDHIRKDLHYRAARYLEKKTRKCLSCGGGYFLNFVGLSTTIYRNREGKLSDLRKGMRKREITRIHGAEKIEEFTTDAESVATEEPAPQPVEEEDDKDGLGDKDDIITHDSVELSTNLEEAAREIMGEKLEEGVTPEEAASFKAENVGEGVVQLNKTRKGSRNRGNKQGRFRKSFLKKRENIGEAKRVKQKKKEEKVEEAEKAKKIKFTKSELKRQSSFHCRNFDKFDFSNCSCYLILTTVYTQLIEHCKGSGRLEKVMDIMIALAYICVRSFNIPQAMRILEDALLLLESKPRDVDSFALWEIAATRAKIQTVIAMARLELGQIGEAFKLLHSAMFYFEKPFPQNITAAFFTQKLKMIKQFLMLRAPKLYVGAKSGYKARYCENLSETLSLMYRMYKSLKMRKFSEVASYWSLNKALESDEHFFCLITAFSHQIDTVTYKAKDKSVKELESWALGVIEKYNTTIEAHELEAVAKLYISILIARHYRGYFDDVINLCQTILGIAGRVKAFSMRIQILHQLSRTLFAKARFVESMYVLKELEEATEHDVDNSGKTWMYSLYMEITLDAGQSVVSFKKCEQFYQEEGEVMMAMRDFEAMRRYFVCIWLWHARHGHWEAVSVWYTKIRNFPSLKSNATLRDIMTSTKILEGHMIQLVKFIDGQDAKAIAQQFSVVSKLEAQIIKASENRPAALPRVFLIRAYLRYVRFHDKGAFNLLNEGKKYAQSFENMIAYHWIMHNEKNWKNQLNPIQAEKWKDLDENTVTHDWAAMEKSPEKLPFFTLPLPKY